VTGSILGSKIVYSKLKGHSSTEALDFLLKSRIIVIEVRGHSITKSYASLSERRQCIINEVGKHSSAKSYALMSQKHKNLKLVTFKYSCYEL
jgi:hypothetical protein